MEVTGAIVPRKYVNVITQHEQKKENSHTTSVGNKRKQTKDVKSFVVYNIVSIV